MEEQSFNDTLFGEWLEAPVVYGAFRMGAAGHCGGLSGVVESPMAHQQSVHFSGEAPALRHATALMEKMLEEAPMRMAVLETQTCNERAIAFLSEVRV